MDKNEARAKLLKDRWLYYRKCLKIRDKDGNIIHFNPKPTQEKFLKLIEEQEQQKKPIRIIILKARREGISTATEAEITRRATTKKGRRATIIAHQSDASSEIFEMSKLMYDELPELMKPSKKKNNGKLLEFEKLRSRIKIETAKNVNASRSKANNDLHCSEVAFWDNAEEVATAIMQTVPDTPESMIVIESTANGIGGFFYDMWKAAKEGKNSFIPLFFPWYEEPEYIIELTQTEREELQANLNQYSQLDKTDYKELIEMYGLNFEQIAWYRRTLWDKCKGDINKMRQEYPSNDIEAFISSGQPVFDNDKLIKRRNELEKNPRGDRGYINNKFEFVPDKNSNLIIYEKPKKNIPYVVAADVAKGIKGGDYSVIQVKDNTNDNQVAKWRGHIEPDLFATEIEKVARYYNYALAGPESNNHGLTTITELKKTYKRIYKVEIIDKITNEKREDLGFNTTGSSRPVLVDRLRERVRNHIETINDIETIDEMLTFVFKDNGKAEHDEGCHDDTVLALGIADMIDAQQSKYPLDNFKPVQRQYDPSTGY